MKEGGGTDVRGTSDISYSSSADPERKIRGNEGKHGCRLITYVLKWEGGGRRVVNREELWSYGK